MVDGGGFFPGNLGVQLGHCGFVRKIEPDEPMGVFNEVEITLAALGRDILVPGQERAERTGKRNKVMPPPAR